MESSASHHPEIAVSNTGKAVSIAIDEDVKAHQQVKALIEQAYSASESHLVALKKRLLEEKDNALLEAKRIHLSEANKFRAEIASLQGHIQSLEASNTTTGANYVKLKGRATGAVARHRRKYSAEYSVRRMFSAWAQEAQISRQSGKLDRIGKHFSDKFIKARSFYTMCLNHQRRKGAKQGNEANFKFDSVTNEMVTSYEVQMANSKRDLTEAYVTIEQEQLRRLQLEEDLRRLFLKNMTSMNFEALSLFSNSHHMLDSDGGVGGGGGVGVGGSPDASAEKRARKKRTPQQQQQPIPQQQQQQQYNNSQQPPQPQQQYNYQQQQYSNQHMPTPMPTPMSMPMPSSALSTPLIAPPPVMPRAPPLGDPNGLDEGTGAGYEGVAYETGMNSPLYSGGYSGVPGLASPLSPTATQGDGGSGGSGGLGGALSKGGNGSSSNLLRQLYQESLSSTRSLANNATPPESKRSKSGKSGGSGSKGSEGAGSGRKVAAKIFL